MARSSRNSAALTFGVLVLAATSLSAHRLDEYLQAARVSIEPDRVDIELDLTPGIAVAERVVSDIDRDRDGAISGVEADTYAARVLEAIRLDLDGTPIGARVVARTFPAIEDMRRGIGTIRLQLRAMLPRLMSGRHAVHYRNEYRTDIGVYLANALVPASDRVLVRDQQRDVNQRTLGVVYTLQDDRSSPYPWLLVAGLTACLSSVVFRRRSPR